MDGQAKRESQISNAFARLDKTIDQLSIMVTQHESSIISVLRDEPEPADECVAESKLQIPQAPQAPIANIINADADKLQDIISRINSIQRRLEL